MNFLQDPLDDLDLRMIPQPGREGSCGPVGQDVDRVVGCHVDEDRRVVPSPSNGELVHAEMRHPSRRGERKRPDQPKQSVLTGIDGYAPEQASAWPTAQEQGHVGELGGESVRPACVTTGQGRYLLGERPTGTVIVPADESTSSQFDSYTSAGDRTIRQSPW
ncbi:hypothetical protein OIE42_35495 [Streptomyces sp. NBC_00648]